MKRIGVCSALLLLFGMSGVFAGSGDEFFFQDGDRIVFLGDSITEQYQYSNDIELFLTTRFPHWHLTFLNAGIGGDRAVGGAARFRRHVLDEKPTALTIDFGMNDAAYGKFNAALQATYLKKTEEMLREAEKAGVRVALISPNAVDRRVKKQGNPELFKVYVETQKEFYAPLRQLAEKYKAPFIDQYAITRAGLEKMEAQQATTLKPFPDGIHTSPAGGWFMAHTILHGLHAPALVSDLDIDAQGGGKILETQHCSVDKLNVSSDGVSFERRDEALPIPVQGNWLPLLPYLNDLKDLNWYGVKVKGLSPGKYQLAIDRKPVDVTFTAEALAQGVNLGNLTTGPIHDQALSVAKAIDAKNQIVHKRFREVVMGPNPTRAELERRMKLIDARQAEVYKIAQPVAHVFELTMVK
jgi:lysophospholipase L1-like esterase